MPDVFTKAKRSEVMSRIRSRGNRDTELALAKLLRAHGITGWRRQRVLTFRSSRGNEAQTHPPRSVRASSRRLLRVSVDFVFPRTRLALFVDGCFWHGCPKHCKYAKWLTPAVLNNPPSPRDRLRRTGRAFWRRKLSANKERDQRVNRALRRTGWLVLRIWECELAKRPEVCVRRIEKALNR